MNLQNAKKAVEEYLSKKSSSAGELWIIDERTLEKEYGWIFFFDSKEFVETGNADASLFGCGPIVLEKDTGNITELGSSFRPEDKISKFEIQLRKKKQP